MALSYVTVTETVDDGTGLPMPNGTVTFTASATVYSAGTPVLFAGAPIRAQVVNGTLETLSGGPVRLLATDNAGLSVEGRTGFWTWNVALNLGGVLDGWNFFLPSSPSTVDLYATANSPAAAGGGTVTTLSVVTANGLAGSVANPTTTPAITLSVPETGILKSNGTAISAAAAGTDYLAPTGSGAGLTGITVGQVAGAAPAASPTFTGTVTVPVTVNATDAAQKAYVDSVAQGLDNKPSVTVLAASNITLSGLQTIDGVGVTAGNRVLATGQTTASQNGIWTVAAGAWTRPSDFASGSSQLGASAFVEGGTAYGSSGWVLTGTTPVAVDTGAQTWTQFSGAGEVNAGTGLSKSGNTLSLSTPVSQVNGGTGATSQQAAINALTGTQSAGKYLRSDGTNASLQLIQAADVPLMAWQFSPLAYGAKGDGQAVTDGAITSGSASLACTTSTPFAVTDVGKHIIVNGAGVDGTSALVTTIATYVDPGHVTLAANAGTTASGAAVLWATDDTAAFQSAINAAAAYAAVHGYAQVYRPPISGHWGIAGPLVNTGSANSQLTIPNPSATSPQYVLEFYAEQGLGVINMWTQTADPQVTGACVSYALFASAGAYVTDYNTHGPAAVLGTTPAYPELLAPVDGLAAFANIAVRVRNWTTVRPQATSGLGYGGVSLAGAAKGVMEDCASLLTCNYQVSSGPNAFPSQSSFQNAESRGLILPYNGNNDMAIATNCTTSGDAFGFQVGEHASLINCRVVGASFIAQLSGNDGAGNQHLIKIINMSAELCAFGFWVVASGQSGVGMFIDAEIDLEGLSGASSLIADSSSGAGLASIFGEIRVYGSYALSYFPTKYPTSVKLIAAGGDGAQVPGYVSGYTGFSTAGTGVAVQNPYWRDVKVDFSGGTITAVAKGATLGGSGGSATTHPSMITTGLSGSGEVSWPSGGWLSFTFTGTPTWNVDVPT